MAALWIGSISGQIRLERNEPPDHLDRGVSLCVDFCLSQDDEDDEHIQPNRKVFLFCFVGKEEESPMEEKWGNLQGELRRVDVC